MPNLKDIKNLLQNNKLTEFVKLNKLSSKDIIEFTNRYTNWAGNLFQHIDVKHAARVFKYLRKKNQEIIIKSLPDEKAAELLNALQPDDRTAFLGLLPGNAVKELLKILAPETRAETLKLLGYPEGSVGRLMTPDYCTIKASDTVQQVLDVVRQRGQAAETLNFLFVVDDNGVLIDDINIKEFLVVDPATPVEKLMDHQYIALSANDEQTETIAIFKNNSRFALPVINESGVLLGIVTSDDVLRLAEKENTREIQRIGGSEALEEPYTTISFGRLVKKRAGWLVILFLGEIKFRDWFYVMRKEIFSGLVLGSILGVVGFFRIFFWQHLNLYNYGQHWMLVGFTVGFSLLGVVLWGTISGSMLPILLKKLGADPAASSAPFVATLVDVTGLIIYFSVAFLILKGTLL